jgi:predicted DNA-binding transcriptional regulator AlpA
MLIIITSELFMVDIANTVFLSADDICSRLSVSKSTFDRWRKINPNAKSPIGQSGFQTKVLSQLRAPADVENEAVGLTTFPEPCLNVGGSPRWNAKVVDKWLLENKDKRNRRGFFQPNYDE